MNRLMSLAAGAACALAVASSHAHGGEDHGPPPVVAARALLPRVTAHSELFEIVGVLEPGRLLLWVDAAASNEPVAGASVEVEGAGVNARADEVAPGVYALRLPKPPAPGAHPLTFTVQAGRDMDLLGAPLNVPAPAAGAGHQDGHEAAAASPRSALGPAGWAALGAAGMAAVMGLSTVLRRRRAVGAGR